MRYWLTEKGRKVEYLVKIEKIMGEKK